MNRLALAALAIVAAVLAAHQFFIGLPNREELGPRETAVRFKPVSLDPAGFLPLRLAGAWEIESDDPRVGGISDLAVDGGSLVALSDKGVIIRFAKPNRGVERATVRELPGGPGNPRFKINRDSEAILRDPSGRGWWVAFENRNELWLYDPAFTRAVRRMAIPASDFDDNEGVEGMAGDVGSLLLFPESGGQLIRFSAKGVGVAPIADSGTYVSDAASLPDGRILLVERSLGPLGFSIDLALLEQGRNGFALGERIPIGVGRLDNVEALAAERLSDGTIRLWMATDDNFHRPLRTLLVAADFPPRN